MCAVPAGPARPLGVGRGAACCRAAARHSQCSCSWPEDVRLAAGLAQSWPATRPDPPPPAPAAMSLACSQPHHGPGPPPRRVRRCWRTRRRCTQLTTRASSTAPAPARRSQAAPQTGTDEWGRRARGGPCRTSKHRASHSGWECSKGAGRCPTACARGGGAGEGGVRRPTGYWAAKGHKVPRASLPSPRRLWEGALRTKRRRGRPPGGCSVGQPGSLICSVSSLGGAAAALQLARAGVYACAP
jgi:hypothetical protein